MFSRILRTRICIFRRRQIRKQVVRECSLSFFRCLCVFLALRVSRTKDNALSFCFGLKVRDLRAVKTGGGSLDLPDPSTDSSGLVDFFEKHIKGHFDLALVGGIE